MTPPLTATELRRNIYRVLDEVLETGTPQPILRNGKKLVIVCAEPRRRRFGDAPQRQVLNCTFDELVATTWDSAWNPDP